MAIEDIEKALASPKAKPEMEEDDEEGGDASAKAAALVQKHMSGDPAKLARALKAFVSMCNEEDY